MLRARQILAPVMLGLAALSLSACQQQAAETADATTAPDAKPGLAVSEGRLILPFSSTRTG